MTKEDLLTGKPFIYTGHFTRLNDLALEYNPSTEVISDKVEFSYAAKAITDNGFIAHNTSFGNIIILYTECKLKEVQP
jgi:hypothetical protein